MWNNVRKFIPLIVVAVGFVLFITLRTPIESAPQQATGLARFANWRDGAWLALLGLGIVSSVSSVPIMLKFLHVYHNWLQDITWNDVSTENRPLPPKGILIAHNLMAEGFDRLGERDSHVRGQPDTQRWAFVSSDNTVVAEIIVTPLDDPIVHMSTWWPDNASVDVRSTGGVRIKDRNLWSISGMSDIAVAYATQQQSIERFRTDHGMPGTVSTMDQVIANSQRYRELYLSRLWRRNRDRMLLRSLALVLAGIVCLAGLFMPNLDARTYQVAIVMSIVVGLVSIFFGAEVILDVSRWSKSRRVRSAS